MPVTTPYAALKNKVQGLFREKINEATEASRFVAPVLSSNGGLGNEWTILRGDHRISVLENVPTVGLNSPHQQLSVEFDTISQTMSRKDGGAILIPERVQRSQQSQAGFAVDQTAMNKIAARLADQHVVDLGRIAAGATASSGDSLSAYAEALDLTNPAFPIVRWARELRREIQKEIGMRIMPGEGYLAVGAHAVDAIADLDDLQNGTSVAIGSSATAQRRTDSLDHDEVLARFLAKTGFRLVLLDTTVRGGTGAPEFVFEDTGLFGFSRAGAEECTLKTFSQDADMFDVDIRPTSGREVRGVWAVGDGLWEVVPVFPESGRRISVALPSS